MPLSLLLLIVIVPIKHCAVSISTTTLISQQHRQHKQDGKTAREIATDNCFLEIVALLDGKPQLVEHMRGAELFTAVQHHDLNRINTLLKAGDVDVNWQDEHGNTALQMAAVLGFEDATVALLANAAVNINTVNKEGDTALQIAAERGFQGVTVALLSQPTIKVNIVNKVGFFLARAYIVVVIIE